MGEEGVVKPIALHDEVVKLVPAFSLKSGRKQRPEQHDCHELLSVLLAGLHEELNMGASSMVPEGNERRFDGIVEDFNIPSGKTKRPSFARLDKALVPDDDGGEVLTKASHNSMTAAISWHSHLVRNKSTIIDIFQGQLNSTLCCKRCGHSSSVFDPFQELTVPLPDVRFDQAGDGQNDVRLEDCLRAFCAPDELKHEQGEEQGWLCVHCKCHSSATKVLKPWRLPPVLIIQLKRFQTSLDPMSPEGTDGKKSSSFDAEHAMKYGVSTAGRAVGGGGGSSREWPCPKCTCSNKVSSMECEACGFDKPTSGGSSTSSGGSSSGGSSSGGSSSGGSSSGGSSSGGSSSGGSSSGGRDYAVFNKGSPVRIGGKRMAVKVAKKCQPVRFPLYNLRMDEFLADEIRSGGGQDEDGGREAAGTGGKAKERREGEAGGDGVGKEGASAVGGEASKGSGDNVYDLFAVCNHHSSGREGGDDKTSHGHYTSIVRNHLDGGWYRMDDGTVSSVKEEEVSSTKTARDAYLLFYQLSAKHTVASPHSTPPRERTASFEAERKGDGEGESSWEERKAGAGLMRSASQKQLHLRHIKRHSLSNSQWQHLLSPTMVGPHSPTKLNADEQVGFGRAPTSATKVGAPGEGQAGGNSSSSSSRRAGEAGLLERRVLKRRPSKLNVQQSIEEGNEQEQPLLTPDGEVPIILEMPRRRSRSDLVKEAKVEVPLLYGKQPPPTAHARHLSPQEGGGACSADREKRTSSSYTTDREKRTKSPPVVNEDDEWWVLYHDLSGCAGDNTDSTATKGVPYSTQHSSSSFTKGVPYWYNERTGISSWTKPTCLLNKVVADPSNAAHPMSTAVSSNAAVARNNLRNSAGGSRGSSSSGGGSSEKPPPKKESADEKKKPLRTGRLRLTLNPDVYGGDSGANANAHTHDEQLRYGQGQPPTPMARGWTKDFDETSGYYYYTHQASGHTTWTKPTARDVMRAARMRMSPLNPAQGEEGGAHPTALPDAHVAEADADVWEEVVDPQTGHVYYHNWRTEQSSWTRPDQLG
jgi:ubiquitin C-terminal hydrolase